MNETERLHQIDRVARETVDALDAALGDIVPPPPPGSTEPSAGRWIPLLVAAVLMVVALLGVSTLWPSEEEGTVAGEPETPTEVQTAGTTKMVLDDPAAHGFGVRAAGRGTWLSNSEDEQVDVAAVTVQEPIGGDSPLVAVSSGPTHDQALSGLVVDIGAPDAVASPHFAGGVQWHEDNEVRSIAAAATPVEVLRDLAASAVAAGWDGEGPLPGHRVLLNGTMADTIPLFELWSLPPSAAAVAYEHEGDLDFVVSTQPGSDAHWRSGFVHAQNVDSVAVAGRDVVVADYFAGARSLRVGSWREADGTIVRVATYGDLRALLELVGRDLRAVDMAEFDQVASEHPLGEGQAMFALDPESVGVDFENLDGPTAVPPGGRVLAEVRFRPGNAAFQATVLEDRHGAPRLLSVEMAGGSGGAGGMPLTDLSSPYVTVSSTVDTTGSAASGTRMVASVVPNGWDVAEVRSRATGETFAIGDHERVPVEGTEADLIVVLIQTPGFDDGQVEVVLSVGDRRALYWS